MTLLRAMKRKSAANQTPPAGAAEHTQSSRLESHPRQQNFVLREYAAFVSILSIIRQITGFIRMSSRLPHASGCTRKSMSHRKALKPAEAFSAIKLMNARRITALFFLMLHRFHAIRNV